MAVLAVLLAGVRCCSFTASPAARWGKGMVAVRDAEIAARSIGLNPVIVKTAAFALSAVFAGLAGGIFAPLFMFVAPDSFPFSQSILFLLAVIVGGAGWVLGPVVGAAVSVVLPELLSSLAEYRLLFFGGLLLVVLWLAPEGVLGTLARSAARASMPRSRGRARLRRRRVPAADGARANLLGQGHRHRLRRHQGRDRRQLHRRARQDHQRDRAERRRQDHRAQHDRRLLPARHRQRSGSATRDLAGAPAWKVARAGIARTYQTTKLFGTMSVLDNVLIALRRGRLGGCSRRPPSRRRSRRCRSAARLSSAIAARLRRRPATCRMSTAGWSRSPARWRCARACCCSTSPPPA